MLSKQYPEIIGYARCPNHKNQVTIAKDKYDAIKLACFLGNSFWIQNERAGEVSLDYISTPR